MNRKLALALVPAVALGMALLCPIGRAAAQEVQPVATVSIAGYDALMADIEFFDKLTGGQGQAKNIEMMVTMFTGGKGLVGLDKTRPLGLLVLPDNASTARVRALAFLPVTDLKPLLELLAQMKIPTQPADNGVTKIVVQQKPVFVKQQGQWAFVAIEAEHLATLPADPTALLTENAKGRDFALALHIGQIPEPTKQMGMMLMDMGVEAGLQPKPGESNEEFATRAKLARMNVAQLKTLANDLDTVLLGVDVNPAGDRAGTARMDVEMTAKPGTKTAEGFALVKNGPSRFAGFAAPGAAMTLNSVSTMAPDDIARTKSLIETYEALVLGKIEKQGLPADKLAKAKKVLGDLFSAVKATIEGGKMDVGGSVLLSPDAATAVAGIQMVDGAKVDAALRELLEAAKEDSPEVGELVKLDAATHGDVKLHTVVIPIPPVGPGASPGEVKGHDAAVKLFGEKVEVVLGASADAVYLAAGRDAMAKLTAAIDRSKTEAGKEIPPSRMVIDLTPLIETGSTFADDPEGQRVFSALKEVLGRAGSDSHITITATPIANGVQQRIELEKGSVEVVTQLVLQAVQAARQAAARAREMRGMPMNF